MNESKSPGRNFSERDKKQKPSWLKTAVISLSVLLMTAGLVIGTNLTKEQMNKEFEKCEQSPWYFITHYCYTYDPETLETKLIPNYPYLKEYIESLHKAVYSSPQNVITEKTRQMTISWATMAYELWALQWGQGDFSALNISRKEEYVDNTGKKGRNYKSLHGKAAYMYNRLPKYLQMGVEFSYLSMSLKIYDKNGNIIKDSFVNGESSNDNSGRSGSFMLIHLDEAAHIEHSENMFSSLSDAAKRCFLMVSTPNGKSNAFGRIRHDADSGWLLLTYHWSKHPNRDQAWYERKCKGRTKLQIARELDISYEDSIAGKLFSFNSGVHVIQPRPIPKEAIKLSAWDFGYTNYTAISLSYIFKGDHYFFDEYVTNKQLPPAIASVYFQKLKDNGLENADVFALGDPSKKQKSGLTGTSYQIEYANEDINISNAINAREDGVRRIEKCLQNTLDKSEKAKPKIYVYSNCTNIIKGLVEAHTPTDRYGNAINKTEYYTEDNNSHINDTIRYTVMTVTPENMKFKVTKWTDYDYHTDDDDSDDEEDEV